MRIPVSYFLRVLRVSSMPNSVESSWVIGPPRCSSVVPLMGVGLLCSNMRFRTFDLWLARCFSGRFTRCSSGRFGRRCGRLSYELFQCSKNPAQLALDLIHTLSETLKLTGLLQSSWQSIQIALNLF